jgi:hypothetical protein
MKEFGAVTSLVAQNAKSPGDLKSILSAGYLSLPCVQSLRPTLQWLHGPLVPRRRTPGRSVFYRGASDDETPRMDACAGDQWQVPLIVQAAQLFKIGPQIFQLAVAVKY